MLLNENGEVSECTSANIFAIHGNRVCTPPLSTSGCLPGITRAILLEEVRADGITIEERALTPSELEESEGVFITSSTRDLLPVRLINGLALPGEHRVLHALQSAFNRYVSAYVAHSLSMKVLVHS